MKIKSDNQSGGQTAHTIVNNSVTNIINNIYSVKEIPLGNETQKLIYLLSEEYSASPLSVMLRGAWVCLEQPDNNPDRLAQAAHSIREFMEKAHELLVEVPVKQEGGGLKNTVIALGSKWEVAVKGTNSVNTTEWTGEIDKPLQKALKSVSDFFTAFSAEHRPRSAQYRAVIETLERSGQPLPSAIAEQRLKTWKELDDYFKKVAHHQIDPTKEEIKDRIEALEKLILDLRYPERSIPIDVLSELDSAISEGETI